MTQVAGSHEALQLAERHRRQLLSICEELVDVDRELGSHQGAKLSELEERVRSDAFRVMVVGAFKRGKSTLVNALLGDKILPSFAVPTTAVLTDVRYAEKPGVKLWRLDGGRGLDPGSVEDIPVEELTDRIRIDIDDPDRESPYGLAEVFWPIELCRNGVVIVDTPGLDEHPDRQRITLEHLHRSDAIIIVQDVLTAMSQSEAGFVDAWLHDYDLLVVFNRINQVDEDEHDEVKRNARKRLAVVRGDLDRRDQLFFVNAKGGLTARQQGSAEGWADSGLARFEDALATYLLTQRHKAKIFAPGRAMQQAARALDRQVPETLRLLAEEHDEVVVRYEREREPLADLERRAAQLDQGLGQAFEQVSHRVARLVKDEVADLAREMPTLVPKVQATTSISLNPVKVKRSSQAFVDEVVKGAGLLAQSRFNEWLREEFVSDISTELSRVGQTFVEQLAGYQSDLDAVRLRLTGLQRDGDEVEHLLDDLVGGVDSGLDVDLSGVGSGAWVAHLMQQVMASLAVLMLWALTPYGLTSLIVASLVAAAGVQGWAADRLKSRILEKVGIEMERATAKEADQSGAKAAEAFLAELRPIAAGVKSNLDEQLAALRGQVEDVLKLKESGEARVAERRAELDALRGRLADASERLDELLGDVALTDTR